MRELIYCTPHDVLREADAIKRELRKQRIALDIRDRNYFLADADTSRARAEAAERLSAQFAAPLLAERTLIDPVQVVLKDEEATTAVAYLEVALVAKDPEKALTKFSFDALVTYAARNATVESPLSREDVRKSILGVLAAHDRDRVAALTDAALERLVGRRILKHHRKLDAFNLAHEQREKLNATIESSAAERVALRRDVVSRAMRFCGDLGIDYEVNFDAVADDIVQLTFRFLLERGRAAAEAVTTDGRYRLAGASVSAFAQRAIAKRPEGMASAAHLSPEKMLDILPGLLEDVLTRPDALVEKHLRRAADAYFLLFALRGTPDVQKALDKLFGRASLMVDASIIVPCIAEALLPAGHRRMTRLLQAAAVTGLKLVVTSDVVNEVRTHLERLRVGYARRVAARVEQVGARDAAMFEHLIIATFLKTRPRESFDRFVDEFMGPLTPDQDLIEWMKHELSVEYEEFNARFDALPAEERGSLHDDWSKRKPRRSWVSAEAFDRLVYHDVRAYLFVEHERRAELGERSRYASRWWWLTLDGVAFRMDDERQRTGARVCMSPDFFAAFLSTQPKSPGSAGALVPIAIDISQLGFVPAEVRDQAMDVLRTHRGEPEYRLQRRLRDLAHRAMAQRGEMAEGGLAGVAAAIDEATATPAPAVAPESEAG